MYVVKKLNNISAAVEEQLGSDYVTTTTGENPDAIVVRSFKMQEYALEDSVLAVARAGAGVNNIPVAEYAKRGVVVFNTPGANANAVKELVLGAMLVASRNMTDAYVWTQALIGQGDISKQVEDGKKRFVGQEIAGKSLGVIGLGAIGGKVANAAVALGMSVIGYDPYLSDGAKAALSAEVKLVENMTDLLSGSDYITLHVAYLPATKEMINAAAFDAMRAGAILINCARGEIVDNTAMLAALASGKLAKYFTDFPCEALLGKQGVIPMPHLGASTPEAEENCAIMAAKQIRAYLEQGNIINSVNYPNLTAQRGAKYRVCLLATASDGFTASATQAVSALTAVKAMASAQRGDYAYMVLDVDEQIDVSTIKVDGLLKIRLI